MECYCGVCPGCRRSLKVERRTSAPVAALSPLVLEIMSERTRPRPPEASLFAQPDDAPPKPKAKRRSHHNPDGLSKAELNERRKKKRAETKEANRAERELIDGVLVHPYAPHGTAHGYNWFGCKCRPCKDSQNRHGKTSRDRRKDAKGDTEGADILSE